MLPGALDTPTPNSEEAFLVISFLLCLGALPKISGGLPKIFGI
jgi:hypothetical protein